MKNSGNISYKDIQVDLSIYLDLSNISALEEIPVTNELICKVADFLLKAKIKITFGKIADLLSINRASIYNTYPAAKTYISTLIEHQKVNKKHQQKIKLNKINSRPDKEIESNSTLDKKYIAEFISIISSLECKLAEKEKIIHILKSKLASLQSTHKNN